MDPIVKDVLESMKFFGPSNYIIWNYKVKTLFIQEGLWRFVDPTATAAHNVIYSTATSLISVNIIIEKNSTSLPSHPNLAPTITIVSVTSLLNLGWKTKYHHHAKCIIISLVWDSILLSMIYLTNPQNIYLCFNHMCDIQSSSRRLSFKKQLYSSKLAKEKAIRNHLQKVNLIKTQLENQGISMLDEDLVDLTLNSLSKNRSTFKQIQKGSNICLPFLNWRGIYCKKRLVEILTSNKMKKST